MVAHAEELVLSDRADERLRTGHVDFATWVGPHLPALKALAVRLVGPDDSKDLMQDTLLRAWRRQETYSADRGSPRGWLVAILWDQAGRRWRRRQFTDVRSPELGHFEDGAARIERRLDVESAVRTLPRRQRQVIVLYYLADLSVEDIAQILRIRPGSVKAHLHAGRSQLRKALEQA